MRLASTESMALSTAGLEETSTLSGVTYMGALSSPVKRVKQRANIPAAKGISKFYEV